MELRAEIEKHSERINRYIVGCKSFHPTQKPVKLYEELIDT